MDINKINASIQNLRDFINEKYGEGWTLESSLSIEGGEIRVFHSETHEYVIEYEKNTHNAFVPKKLLKATAFKKNFYLPVSWEMTGFAKIEASNAREARKIFWKNIDNENYDIVDFEGGELVDGSLVSSFGDMSDKDIELFSDACEA